MATYEARGRVDRKRAGRTMIQSAIATGRFVGPLRQTQP